MEQNLDLTFLQPGPSTSTGISGESFDATTDALIKLLKSQATKVRVCKKQTYTNLSTQEVLRSLGSVNQRGKQHKCDMCQTPFFTKRALKVHQVAIHYQCPQSGAESLCFNADDSKVWTDIYACLNKKSVQEVEETVRTMRLIHSRPCEFRTVHHMKRTEKIDNVPNVSTFRSLAPKRGKPGTSPNFSGLKITTKDTKLLQDGQVAARNRLSEILSKNRTIFPAAVVEKSDILQNSSSVKLAAKSLQAPIRKKSDILPNSTTLTIITKPPQVGQLPKFAKNGIIEIRSAKNGTIFRKFVSPVISQGHSARLPTIRPFTYPVVSQGDSTSVPSIRPFIDPAVSQGYSTSTPTGKPFSCVYHPGTSVRSMDHPYDFPLPALHYKQSNYKISLPSDALSLSLPESI